MKHCRCGVAHTTEDWLDNASRREWDFGEDGLLEIGECLCGSTLAVEITKDADGTVWRWQT